MEAHLRAWGEEKVRIMPTRVTVLTATDLHLRPRLYDDLTDAVKEHRPDFVALVGDFLDGDDPSEVKWARLSCVEAACRLAAMETECGFVLGNHEPGCWEAFADAWITCGRSLNVLHGTSISVGRLKITGFPCLMGGAHDLPGVPQLRSKDAASWLPSLVFNEGRSVFSLWLMHEPPVPELCEEWALNERWGSQIAIWQPLVVVCGHDHKHVRQTGTWHVDYHGSTIINVGQKLHPIPGPLNYCLLKFDFADDDSPLPHRFTFERCQAREIVEAPF